MREHVVGLPTEAAVANPQSVTMRRPVDNGRRILRTLVVPHAALTPAAAGQAVRDPDGLLWRVERRVDRPQNGDMVLQVVELREAEVPPGQGVVQLPGPVEVVQA